ncbi:unnamed protein product, partial [Polarella glacialis]
ARLPSRLGPSRSGVTASRLGASRPAGIVAGPVGADGYHDLVLPCGLCQDLVIELMYRDLNPEDFEALNKLDERVPKKDIAQRNIVDRFPRVVAESCGCTQCGVCLAEVGPTVRVVQLPCRHGFHPTCISRWLTQCKNTCPLCSAQIERTQEGTQRSSAGGARTREEALQVCSV